MVDAGSLTRRGFLQATAGAAGLSLSGLSVSGSSAAEGRFIVDTRSADSEQWKDGVTVLHTFEKVGVAIVKGDSSALGDVRYTQDFEIKVSPPESHKSEDRFDPDNRDDANPPSEFQWDKQAQGVSELHDAGITGDGASVSIIDTGVDPDHPDLDDNYDFKRSMTWAGETKNGTPAVSWQYHGSHVAGIAAGNGDWLVTGTAPEATIISHNVFGSTPYAFFGDIFGALYHSIVTGADVANMSLGAYPVPPVVEADLLLDILERISSFADSEGMVVVVAAGNDATNLDTDGDVLNLPSQTPGFMSISATGPIGFSPPEETNGNAVNGELDEPVHLPSFFTNYGEEALDVSAAGGNVGQVDLGSDGDFDVEGWYYDLVFSAAPDPFYFIWAAGTSMAAPQVTGLAALVKSQNPSAATQQVRQHIRNTAEQVDYQYDVQNVLFDKPTYFGADGWLADPYDSALYRGEGHIDVFRAATKDVPFDGGIEIEGEAVYPADLDDDGLYEDVNGDGRVDMKDAEALYQIALRDLVSPYAGAFDFNGDGQFDMHDVQALVRQLEQR